LAVSKSNTDCSLSGCVEERSVLPDRSGRAGDGWGDQVRG
jgi:hypothetical protein